jgi:pimeloyl-ACP methyl ester carboxylesterase
MLHKIAIDNKVSLCYKYIGLDDSSLPLLLFLHEGLGSIAQWKHFPDELCSKLQLPGLIYERYGYGHSTPLQENRKDDYLHVESDYYLPLFIKALKLENRPLILIGHSDGGTIALLYTSLFPTQVKYIVSMAAHVFVEQISTTSAVKLIEKYKHHADFREKFKKYHFEHADNTFYQFAETISRQSFQSWNIENCLPKINTPILILQGKSDHYGTEKQVYAIFEKTKSSKKHYLLIDNCGHSPHLEAKEIVLTEIQSFHKEIRISNIELFTVPKKQ